MALIGNPMDFDRIRQKYESLIYPSGRRNNFDQVRDSYAGLLGNQGQVDPLTGQPINMSALTSGGFNVTNQDATQGGQQVQFRLNPQTGATEAIIPEYMGGFRTDQQDFFPDTGGFENIYDADLGKIDPNTGQVKPDPVVDPGTGVAAGVLSAGRGDGRMGGYYGFQNRDGLGMNPVTHEVINNVAYRINKVTGEVEMLSGIDEMIAKTLNTYVTNPISVAGLLNTITGGVNKSYHEKMKDLKNINEDAYNELALNVKEQYAVQTEEEDKPFNIVDEVSNFFTGLFADPDDKKGDGPQDTGPGVGGFTEQDDAREQYGKPTGGNGSGSNGSSGNTGGPQGGGGSGQSGPDAAGAAGSSFCFAPNTLVQMADGSEKEIQNIKLGDDTKGGKVELVVQTLGHNVYNYKGIEVSGSHWVVEDGEYIEVETSKHAKPIDDKEMLYCLNTSDHAIWVKDIQFSDFIGFGLDYSVPGVHKFWESIKDKHTESIN